jgi:hypothetical protein
MTWPQFLGPFRVSFNGINLELLTLVLFDPHDNEWYNNKIIRFLGYGILYLPVSIS